jgi:uncharacterized protein (DUF305 family)
VKTTILRIVAVPFSALLVASCHARSHAHSLIIQPGPPGSVSHSITADKASDLSHVEYTARDVQFMQGMIGHHAQALEMTALLPSRTLREDMRLLARRIELSQADEIQFMRRWLEVRRQEVPGEHAHHMAGAALMPGMLTPGEMMHLEQATGAAFDRLFLESMIKHHEGALVMVEDLLGNPGAAQDSDLSVFTSDIVSDQRAEIIRMTAMLEEFSK